VLVGFESSSEVFPPARDNPRPYRIWTGTLEVKGARLVSMSAPGFDNRYSEWARIRPTQPSLVEFYVETRGRKNTMLVELDGAGPNTVFEIHLEPATEHGFSAPMVRQPVQIPGADLRLKLSDLRDNRLEHAFQVGRHTDYLSLQVVDPAGPVDREFEYTDLDSPARGDYYYVRVRQIDGARAWSSPFRVGSRPPSPTSANP
jgi:hypothetical protein